MNDLLESFSEEKSIQAFGARDRLTGQYAWAVPNDAALEAIAFRCVQDNVGIVEVGAGTGYWASLLAPMIDPLPVNCYDRTPPDQGDNFWHPNKKTFYEVKRGGPEKVSLHKDSALFLCWPPYLEPMAFECLQRFEGDVFFYVGEWWGGCTADDNFFQLVKDRWDSELVEIPNWWGVHDALYVCTRKPE